MWQLLFYVEFVKTIKKFWKKTFTNLSPPFYVWHKKSDFPAKILIATWCNHIGISCRIIFISDIECFFMSERVYQLEFTIKYNFRHVYLICCNFIFGGKIRFFMSDVEWRWQVGKSFFFKNQSLFFESLSYHNVCHYLTIKHMKIVPIIQE